MLIMLCYFILCYIILWCYFNIIFIFIATGCTFSLYYAILYYITYVYAYYITTWCCV